MTSRSRFSKSYRTMMTSTLAVVLAAVAACGGKVAGGGPTTSTEPEQMTCGKNVPSCATKCDDTGANTPTCIDGTWVCPVPANRCKPHACDPRGQPDCLCGTATCLDGSWSCPRSCGCPSDLAAAPGTKCFVEGESCGGEGCTNSCEFCNIIQCSRGVWTPLEAFPDPSCSDDSGPIDAGFHD